MSEQSGWRKVTWPQKQRQASLSKPQLHTNFAKKPSHLSKPSHSTIYKPKSNYFTPQPTSSQITIDAVQQAGLQFSSQDTESPLLARDTFSQHKMAELSVLKQQIKSFAKQDSSPAKVSLKPKITPMPLSTPLPDEQRLKDGDKTGLKRQYSSTSSLSSWQEPLNPPLSKIRPIQRNIPYNSSSTTDFASPHTLEELLKQKNDQKSKLFTDTNTTSSKETFNPSRISPNEIKKLAQNSLATRIQDPDKDETSDQSNSLFNHPSNLVLRPKNIQSVQATQPSPSASSCADIKDTEVPNTTNTNNISTEHSASNLIQPTQPITQKSSDNPHFDHSSQNILSINERGNPSKPFSNSVNTLPPSSHINQTDISPYKPSYQPFILHKLDPSGNPTQSIAGTLHSPILHSSNTSSIKDSEDLPNSIGTSTSLSSQNNGECSTRTSNTSSSVSFGSTQTTPTIYSHFSLTPSAIAPKEISSNSLSTKAFSISTPPTRPHLSKAFLPRNNLISSMQQPNPSISPITSYHHINPTTPHTPQQTLSSSSSDTSNSPFLSIERHSKLYSNLLSSSDTPSLANEARSLKLNSENSFPQSIDSIVDQAEQELFEILQPTSSSIITENTLSDLLQLTTAEFLSNHHLDSLNLQWPKPEDLENKNEEEISAILDSFCESQEKLLESLNQSHLKATDNSLGIDA